MWVFFVSVQALAFDVVVENVSGGGDVGCALYYTDDGFPGDVKKAAQAVLVPAARAVDGTVRCHFDEPPVAKVAVAVRHDRDGDGKLDTNLAGFPREPYGFGNDAPLRSFGPPRFEDALVDARSNARVTLRVP